MGRKASFLVVIASYIAACIVGYVAFAYFKDINMLRRSFIADFVATVAIWILSHVFKNASLYDPYWSVQPVMLWILWFINSSKKDTTKIIFSFVPILIWSVRLTMNWAVQWKGLGDQDWRYTKIHDFCPMIWPISNLVGIQLVPTIVVFLGMTPVYELIFNIEKASGLSAIGSILSVFSAVLQLVADVQMIKFRANNKDKKECIREGVWKYSRHPNYLGEILFWWGVWIVQFASNTNIVWAIIGPVTVTLLFIFISIPLMETKMLKSRPSYAKIQKEVSVLIPLPPFNQKKD
jgi:steroid 5-alpha reductase family enzyme